MRNPVAPPSSPQRRRGYRGAAATVMPSQGGECQQKSLERRHDAARHGEAEHDRGDEPRDGDVDVVLAALPGQEAEGHDGQDVGRDDPGVRHPRVEHADSGNRGVRVSDLRNEDKRHREGRSAGAAHTK